MSRVDDIKKLVSAAKQTAMINPNNDLKKQEVMITAQQIAEIADEVRNGARYAHAMGRLGFSAVEARQIRQQVDTLDREVTKAESEAYSRASQAVFHRDPLKWLLQGPGRESEAFVGEKKEVNFQTQEPLRVAHAHLHQNVPQAQPSQVNTIEDDTAQFLRMSKEERARLLAELEADLDER